MHLEYIWVDVIAKPRSIKPNITGDTAIRCFQGSQGTGQKWKY